jgi:type VI secretion system protein ImpC
VASRLPYNLIAARIAHYLKVMARDKIGSMMQAADVEKFLNRWLTKHINSNPASAQSLKFRFPLAEGKVEVKEVEGQPGSYNAIAWLKPWLALEELSTSLRLVASIPAGGGGGEEGGGGGGEEGGGEE